MARLSIRSHRLLPLLAVLFFCAAAAASPEQAAVRAVRTALDRAQLDEAKSLIDDALARFGMRDSEAVWALRVMGMELAISRLEPVENFTLPAKYATSETAVQWWIMRALAERDEKLLGHAERIATKHHPALLADVYMYRSSLNWKASDAEKGLRLAREHRRPVMEAKALTNLSLFLFHEAHYAEAVERGEQAVALSKKLNLPKLRQTAEGNLGWAYFELGDYESAEELLRSAEETARQIGAKRDHPLWLVQLGNIEFQKRHWARSAEYNREAAANGPSQRGYALANLARAALEQGDYRQAAVFNRDAMEAKKGDQEAVLSSRVIDARIAAHDGHFDRARTLLEEVAAKSKVLATRIEARTYLAKLYVSAGRHEEARAQFDEAVKIAHEERGKIDAPELRFSFFNTVEGMYDAYVDFLVQNKYVYAALAVTESSRAQSLGMGRRISGTFDPRPIAKAYGATILCYWLGRNRSYVWVITPEDVKVGTLPPDTTVEKLAQAYRTKSLGPDARASMKQGKELFRLLVPGDALPKNGRVIVVADGQLHTLNFETLVTPAGHYWIQDVVVMNAPSLQFTMRPKAAGGSPSILLVGNAPSVDPSFPVLKHAKAELDRVGALFDHRTVLQDTEATPEAFKAAARTKYDYVHIAAHGVASRKRPLDSAVILARRDPNSSYKLLAREVVEQPLDARLVTISSCHGAGQRTYTGEGVVGLAWAFLKAGADQVIAALWEVDDAASLELMETMYSAIQRGSDPADALRAAKLRLVNSETANRNPRYWAPFVLYAGN
ncbi:MAG TPA: CHAT domain-containing tetratricopeptide repeat protein [Thermoanaerobaculia bacterium]|nr:CHAT domain-containing tetratricopeptide repeat protein [Thermoanaerobaculia bacterium]